MGGVSASRRSGGGLPGGVALDDRRRSAILLALFPVVALGLLNQFYNAALYARAPFWHWVTDVAQHVLVPAAALLFLARVHGIGPGQYGLRRPSRLNSTAEHVAEFAFVSFMFWLSYEPVREIAYRLLWPWSGPNFSYVQTVPPHYPLKFVVAVYLSASAALVEEIAYRGLPWLYLSQFKLGRLRVPLYVVLSGMLFAAIHSEQTLYNIVAALSLGLVSAWLYAHVRNLWPFVLGHFVTDMLRFAGT